MSRPAAYPRGRRRSQSLRTLIGCALVLTGFSCMSVRQIGRVNMISNRNVNPQLNYQPLVTYAGGSRGELTSSQSMSIEDAVNRTVRRVPGGEFVVNAKIYLVDEKYFAVEGDVWGAAEQAYRGFKVGDRVTFKNPALFTTQRFLLGTVVALKSTEHCLVQPDEPGASLIEVSYDDLTRTTATTAPAPLPSAPRPAVLESPTPSVPLGAELPSAPPPTARRVPKTGVAPTEAAPTIAPASTLVTPKCDEKTVRAARAAGVSDRTIRVACEE